MRQFWSLRTALIAAGALGVIGIAAPVIADCYDLLGCSDKDLFSNNYSYLVARDGPNCDFLYTVRNRIYQQHGYCFTTPRAIQELGNDGCYIHDQSAIRLSAVEQANIATIRKAEAAKGCSE